MNFSEILEKISPISVHIFTVFSVKDSWEFPRITGKDSEEFPRIFLKIGYLGIFVQFNVFLCPTFILTYICLLQRLFRPKSPVLCLFCPTFVLTYVRSVLCLSCPTFVLYPTFVLFYVCPVLSQSLYFTSLLFTY